LAPTTQASPMTKSSGRSAGIGRWPFIRGNGTATATPTTSCFRYL
jgi:hypothetical protein